MENARLYDLERERVETLKHLNDKLRALDQMKSEFMSIASHQLRTPLSGIQGYLSMLTNGDFGELDAEQIDIINTVSDNTGRLIKLVADFLNLSRIESGRLKLELSEVNLPELALGMVKEYKPIAKERDIEVEFVSPSDSSDRLIAHADASKLSEVLSNIIDNAIKYTEKGSVRVMLERTDESYITIQVKDTGIGIPKEQQELLFQKFSRGERSSVMNTEGLGIGLYIVKNLSESMGGSVWFESEGAGKGTTFYVKLIALGGPADTPDVFTQAKMSRATDAVAEADSELTDERLKQIMSGQNKTQ